MTDGPFEKYEHENNPVLARQVTRRKVVGVDDFGNDIVLDPGDWEIIDETDGTHYGNRNGKFQRNFRKRR